MSDEPTLGQRLASLQEVGELVDEQDAGTIDQLERLAQWLDSDPEMTDADRESLRAVADDLRESNPKRWTGLVSGLRGTAGVVEAFLTEPGATRVAVLAEQSARVNRVAVSFRIGLMCEAVLWGVERALDS